MTNHHRYGTIAAVFSNSDTNKSIRCTDTCRGGSALGCDVRNSIVAAERGGDDDEGTIGTVCVDELTLENNAVDREDMDGDDGNEDVGAYDNDWFDDDYRLENEGEDAFDGIAEWENGDPDEDIDGDDRDDDTDFPGWDEP